MDASQENPRCGICGRPLNEQHAHVASSPSASGEGRRVEYIVVGRRGATAEYQAVQDPSKTYKTGATELAEQLGIGESGLVGSRFDCWVERAEFGVIRRDFRLR